MSCYDRPVNWIKYLFNYLTDKDFRTQIRKNKEREKNDPELLKLVGKDVKIGEELAKKINYKYSVCLNGEMYMSDGVYYGERVAFFIDPLTKIITDVNLGCLPYKCKIEPWETENGFYNITVENE